jgi:hypothetical protein
MVSFQEDRQPFSRPQLLAFVVGALQVAIGATQLFPLPDADHALQICTGLLGIALCRKHHHARFYGVAMVVVYGQLLITTVSPLVLGLPTAEALVYARAAAAGLVIAMLPAGPPG